MPLDIQIIDLVIQLLNKIEFRIRIKFEILFFVLEINTTLPEKVFHPTAVKDFF